MKNVLIWGLGDRGRELYFGVTKYTPDRVVGFVVDDQYKDRNMFCALPVTVFSEVKYTFPSAKYTVLAAISGTSMNSLRADVFSRCKAERYEMYSFIHPSAQVDTTRWGEGNIILSHVCIEHSCVLGDGNFIDYHASINHDCVLGNFNYIAAGSVILGRVHIGNYCFLGANCTLRDMITVQDNTLIGAGAYIDHSTEIGDVFVPARSVKLNRKSNEIRLFRDNI